MLSHHLASSIPAHNSPDIPSSYHIASICSFDPMASIFHSAQFWIVDSGAFRHIYSNAILFISLKWIWNSTVNLPNNSKILVRLYGDVQLAPHLLLKDVLFVPQFTYNLISVTALTIASSLTITFFHDHFLIQELHSSKMIGTSNKFKDLYLFYSKTLIATILDNQSSISVNHVLFLVNNVSVNIWHHRLGHLSFK